MDHPKSRKAAYPAQGITLPDQVVDTKAKRIKGIGHAVSQVFVGKESIIQLLLNGFIAGLHVLIEDVPGVGKTTLARSLAASVGLDFSRIQFTPDLLPGDVTGVTVWSQEQRGFVYKEGAIMHQFILADEINRASPRTQSSLLEAMQEETVSVDGRTYSLPPPFFVIATQNPSEFLGTFPLPEGELDRFGLSFSIGYPEREEERSILNRFKTEDPLAQLKPVMAPEEVIEIRQMVRKVYIADEVQEFIIEIAAQTRSHPEVQIGASPRAAQHLQLASQGRALMNGRAFIIPEDVVTLAPAVLAHRLILSGAARVEGKTLQEVVGRIVRDCRIPIGLKL